MKGDELARDILRTIIALSTIGSVTLLAIRGVIDAAAVTAILGAALGAVGATAAVAVERHRNNRNNRSQS